MFKKVLLLSLCILFLFCLTACGQSGGKGENSNAAPVLASEKDDTVSKTDDFSVTAGKYYFSSGAGGWSTDIEVKPDGSFSGDFHDSDYIDEDGCVAQILSSTFKGKFEDIKKINDYTYSFSVKSIKYEQPIGKEEIIDEDYGRVKYVYSDAYGLAKAKTVYLFTKGAPVSELPEEYREWARYPGALSETDTVLPFKGLYNVDEKYGFVGE